MTQVRLSFFASIAYEEPYLMCFVRANGGKGMEKKSVNIKEAKAQYDKEKYRDSGSPNAINGINTPGVDLPAFNPPVPNRAWTEMKSDIISGGSPDKKNRKGNVK